MRKIIYIYLIPYLLLLSCQNTTYQEQVQCIDYDNLSNGDFIIKEIEYVPLETTDQSLLGSIKKVLFKNNKFYILDTSENNGVYIFDRKGRFLSAINKQGEAPDEYIELMDMDVDNEGNVYIADNARMNLLKYNPSNSELQEIIHTGLHFFEFACLDSHSFLLRDVFDPKEAKAKLAYYDATSKKLEPILKSQTSAINEMSIMKCSKHYLYRSGNQIYYNERFTPEIYSLSTEGKLTSAYSIHSDSYIQEDELKGMENKPLKFIQETTHIKDITCLYENETYFICAPFIVPSSKYVLIPKEFIFLAPSTINGSVVKQYFPPVCVTPILSFIGIPESSITGDSFSDKSLSFGSSAEQEENINKNNPNKVAIFFIKYIFKLFTN